MVVNTILIGLGIVFGLYLLHKLFFNKIQVEDDYDKVYKKVMTSDEYKVKGQYDKR